MGARALILEQLPDLPAGVDLNDPSDAFLFAMALAGQADFLVTGDRRAGLLQRGNAGPAQIVTPAAFCAKALWRWADPAPQPNHRLIAMRIPIRNNPALP